MSKLFTFLLLWSLSLRALALDPDPVKVFCPDEVLPSLGQRGVGQVTERDIPQQFLLPVQLALSYYPELKDCKICFRQKNIRTTMQCVPAPGFLFQKRKNRTYRINIDNKVVGTDGLLLSEVPFNAQVGVVGHELGHIVDYSSRSSLGVLFLGLKYLFAGKRRQTEHRVDRITIDHGLGNQLEAFSKFVFTNDKIGQKYLKYKRRFYYSPERLEQLISANPRY